jgi:vacuolar-type H+-ATPase subunit I/STV1
MTPEDQLRALIAELGARIAELEIAAGLCNNANARQYARIASLEAERDRLREALAAYREGFGIDLAAALDGGK